MTKKVVRFLEEKIGWHHEYAAPGDIDLSDATVTVQLYGEPMSVFLPTPSYLCIGSSYLSLRYGPMSGVVQRSKYK